MRFRKTKCFHLQENRFFFRLDTILSDGTKLVAGYIDEKNEPECIKALENSANGLKMQAPNAVIGYECTFIE